MINLPLPPPPADKHGYPWELSASAAVCTSSSLPRITIVTPSYNQGHYLEETIRSVLAQGYPNLEYIVIDGGSKDNSVEIIQKYAAYLSYWVSEPDHGQAHAINKGFARATGEVMGWLNSDDLMLPGALCAIGQTFDANPATSVVYGLRKVIDANSRVQTRWLRGIPDEFIFKRVDFIPQETVYWSRRVWEQVGGLDESFQFALDYEFFLRILQRGYDFNLLPHYIGAFRMYADGKTSAMPEIMHLELPRIYEKYRGQAMTLTQASADLGWRRRMVLRLLKEMEHQSFMDNARLAWLLMQAANNPLLSLPLIALHRVYRLLRDLSRRQLTKVKDE
ncbi:MAG: glycosyltransferase [Anaerolineae bacterium]|nr:glycosyltransferase [Anaerolineae bacterium]